MKSNQSQLRLPSVNHSMILRDSEFEIKIPKTRREKPNNYFGGSILSRSMLGDSSLPQQSEFTMREDAPLASRGSVHSKSKVNLSLPNIKMQGRQTSESSRGNYPTQDTLQQIRRANQEALNFLIRKARAKKKPIWVPNGH